MKLRSKLALVALVATSAIALSACTASPSSSGSHATTSSIKGGTLTIATAVDLTSFDPTQAHQGHSVQFYQPVYDSVLRVAPNGTTIEPFLATKWSYNAAKTVLTMTIRKGVKFSDGTPLNAAAIKLNLDRFRTGNGPDASTLSDVSNISAPSSTSLVISLKAPDPSLLNYLGNEDGFIASPKAIAAGHIATAPVGSGPYTYDASASVIGSKYVFNAKKGYWDPSLQKFKQIVLMPILTPTATLNALLSGQVDAALLTPQTSAQATSAGMTQHKYYSGWEGLFILDRDGTQVPALKNVKVRQAINLAIDKEALNKTVESGLGTLTSQLLPPGVPGYVKALDKLYTYNVSKAKSLMKEAGYANGFTVKMPTAAGAINPALQAGLTANLGAIGITVDWVNIPSTSYITDLATGKFPMAWFKEAQGTAWYTSEVLLAPNAVYNPLHTTDPKVESLISEVQKGSNTAAVQLYTYIANQAWFAPFYRDPNLFFTDSKVSVVVQQHESVPYIYNYSPKG